MAGFLGGIIADWKRNSIPYMSGEGKMVGRPSPLRNVPDGGNH